MFAKRLGELRRHAGLTQVQFAKDFGISKGTIAMWETAKRSPDLATISKLADYFSVTVDYLLGKSNRPSEVAVTDEDLKFALFHGVEGITDAAYEEVKAFAQFVKHKHKPDK